VRAGDYLLAVQDVDVKWSRHAQVVERIKSHHHSCSVKLTLVRARPISREVAIFCGEDNEANNIRKCSDLVEQKSNPSKPISTKSLNERKLWNMLASKNKTSQQQQSSSSEQAVVPKSLRIKQCLMQKLSASSSKKDRYSQQLDLLDDANGSMLTATTKLCDLASSQSNLLFAFETVMNPKDTATAGHKLSNKFKSVSDLLSSNESTARFVTTNRGGQSVKSAGSRKWSSSPLTSTITLGRRFKANVMKLSIFNVFGPQPPSPTTPLPSPKPANESAIVAMNEEDESSLFKELFEDVAAAAAAVKTSSGGVKSTKVRILKKQKKLKKLEKLFQEQSCEAAAAAESEMIYRTI
jgi:hypothetical protein